VLFFTQNAVAIGQYTGFPPFPWEQLKFSDQCRAALQLPFVSVTCGIAVISKFPSRRQVVLIQARDRLEIETRWCSSG
jgi:hypothetical protein